MLTWNLLYGNEIDEDDFQLGICKENCQLALLNTGRRRVFHRINLEHLLFRKDTLIDPQFIPELFDDSGIGSKYYLELFPHRMIHMGNLDMTCFFNNLHPVVFSFNIDNLERKAEKIHYINLTYYMEYCAEFLNELAVKRDQECIRTIEEAKDKIFESDRTSLQDQRDCEVVLPNLELRWSDFVIVFNNEDYEEVVNWCEEVELKAPVFNFSNIGINKIAKEAGISKAVCYPKKCLDLLGGLKQLLETAFNTGQFDVLRTPTGYPMGDEEDD